MTLPKIADLTETPVVGRWYLVPCVRQVWYDVLANWPVIGPRHNDADRFAIKTDHWHIDPRFVARRLSDRVEAREGLSLPYLAQLGPLHIVYDKGQVAQELGLLRRRCWISSPPYNHGHQALIRKLRSDYAGHKCRRGSGWICPHRGADLGSIGVDADGVQTCPLHGLRINATSGVCMEATA